MQRWPLAYSFFSLIALVPTAEANSGFDTPFSAEVAVELFQLKAVPPAPRDVTWLRIRGMHGAPVLRGGASAPDAATAEVQAEISAMRADFARLRSAGYRTACMLRWNNSAWSAVRAGAHPGVRAPLDLREAYGIGYALAQTYGDLVDVWEIENEPDINFFADGADVFAAYYKAMALGIAQGRRVSARAGEGEDGRTERAAPGLVLSFPLVFGTSVPSSSLVLMPAMCLPPGPYFEQLLDNGLLSYTEGLNYHYYGFAMDYAGVHAQWRDVVTQFNHGGAPEREDGPGHSLRTRSKSGAGEQRRVPSGLRWELMHEKHERRTGAEGNAGRRSLPPGAVIQGTERERAKPPERRLPVFTTEWGYSLLDGYAAQTVEGRVRQWRFFKTVAELNTRLGVDAPMAFLLQPYYEHKMKEFGLSMVTEERREAHYGYVVGADFFDAKNVKIDSMDEGSASGVLVGGASADTRSELPERTFSAGGLMFRPEDFGANEVEPWMRRIGEKVGDAEASPALAWLLENARASAAVARENGGLARLSWLSRKTGWGLPTRLDAAAVGGVPGIRVRTEAASPVVLDFIASAGTDPMKGFHGYWLGGAVPEANVSAASSRAEDAAHVAVTKPAPGTMRPEAGVMMVYNFGVEVAEVVIDWPDNVVPLGEAEGDTDQRSVLQGEGNTDRRSVLHAEGNTDQRSVLHAEGDTDRRSVRVGRSVLRLMPGERREIRVEVRAREDAFLPTAVTLAAEVRSGGKRTVARWATRFYTNPKDYVELTRDNLVFSAEAATANRELLLARPHAPEEPALRPQGRWLVSEGMRVEETPTGWLLKVDHFSGVGLRPAVAELPLPSGWRLPEGGVLTYHYRITLAEGAVTLQSYTADPQRRLQTGTAGAIAESYIRTTNGNLFSTVPRLSPREEWKRYNQSGETMTMLFLGRTEMPWRFAENTPASLVFFVRATELPAVFEVHSPHVATYGRPARLPE